MIAGSRLEPDPARDWSNRLGAEALAAAIRRFWIELGHNDVLVWIEPLRGGKDPVWTVKSSLRSGLPPTAAAIARGSPGP